MALPKAKVLAFLVCSAASAQAHGLVGAAEGLTTSKVSGWACDSDTATYVSVAAYAGSVLLGIYPLTVKRPDVAKFCRGGQPYGFAFPIDAATQALFAGQTQLAVYAVAPGLPPLLLPSANPQTVNPLPLPTGTLLGLISPQEIAVATGGSDAAPKISLFTGGPANQGLGLATAVAQPVAGGGYGVQIPVSGLTTQLSASGLLTVFGTITNALGATTPLVSPLSLPVSGLLSGTTATAQLTVPFSVTRAQSGSYTGIRNDVFTAWVPANMGFAGLSGTVSLSGDSAAFEEGLVELGYAPYDQADCLKQNGKSLAGLAGMSPLWSGIMKNNAIGTVAIPVNFALPYAVATPSGGGCLMTLISSGYAYLSSGATQYATTQVAMQAKFVTAAQNAPQVTPVATGGEFHFVGGIRPTSTYVGIMATTPLAVDGIAASASAAPVTGPAVASQWQPAPQRNWSVQTSFVYLPASACAAANLYVHPTNGTFAVVRNGSAAAIAIPPGAVSIIDMPMNSFGAQAIHRSAYAALPAASGNAGFSGTLQPGDCLVAFTTATVEPLGVLDYENQSTLFLRLLQ